MTTNSKCILCRTQKGAIIDSKYVCSLKHGYVILHRNQIYKGRCYYVSYDHIDDPALLSKKALYGYTCDIQCILKCVKAAFAPELTNVCILGNQIRHLHWHVIPRYADDPNWGGPPWPTREEKLLNGNGYRRLATMLRQMFVQKGCYK